MKDEENNKYFCLNWKLLEELSMADKTPTGLSFYRAGLDFIQRINCVHTLGIFLFIASYSKDTMFDKRGVFERLFSDSIGNSNFLDLIIEKMFKQGIII